MKKTGYLALIGLVIVFAIVFTAIFLPPVKAQSPKDAKKIEAQFNVDGSHIKLDSIVRGNAYNAISVRHVSTTKNFENGFLFVLSRYQKVLAKPEDDESIVTFAILGVDGRIYSWGYSMHR